MIIWHYWSDWKSCKCVSRFDWMPSADRQSYPLLVWLVNTTCKGHCPEARGYYIGLRRMIGDHRARESKWIWSSNVTWTENETQVTHPILDTTSDHVLRLSSVMTVSPIIPQPGYKMRMCSVTTVPMANRFVAIAPCALNSHVILLFTREWQFGTKASRIIIVTVSFNQENIASKSSGVPIGMVAGRTRLVNWMIFHVTNRR